MAGIQYHQPLVAPPSQFARVNNKHWLANRLIFAHSGFNPFWWHKPGIDTKSVLRKVLPAAPGNSALTGVVGWIPNGLTYEVHESNTAGIIAMLYPVTLSAWWFGVAGTTNDAILSIRQKTSTGDGGFSLERRSSERVGAVGYSSTATASAATATGGYTSGTWQHGVGVFEASNKRRAYADAANSATGTGTQSWTLGQLAPVVIGANAVGESTGPAICTAVIQGIALPLIIEGALQAEEILRLFNEQRSNPWALFKERPIWVPVTAAAPSFLAAWVPRQSQSIGAR